MYLAYICINIQVDIFQRKLIQEVNAKTKNNKNNSRKCKQLQCSAIWHLIDKQLLLPRLLHRLSLVDLLGDAMPAQSIDRSFVPTAKANERLADSVLRSLNCTANNNYGTYFLSTTTNYIDWFAAVKDSLCQTVLVHRTYICIHVCMYIRCSNCNLVQ